MCLLPNTPTHLKFIYKIIGLVQFSDKTQETLFSKICNHFWCVPFCSYFIYLCVCCEPYDHSDLSLFVYLSSVSYLANIFCISILITTFGFKANELKCLLLEINAIDFREKSIKKFDWHQLLLTGLYLAHFAFIPYLKESVPIVVFFYILPITINCFDNLFKRDVLNLLVDKFKFLNKEFERQSDLADLQKSFPLTKTKKIKFLENEEIDWNLRYIEELSQYHYQLVHLSLDICKNFEIGLVITLTLWFEKIIESTYFSIFTVVNDDSSHHLLTHVLDAIHAIFEFYWLFTSIENFTRVQTEANKTPIFVHDVWNKYVKRNFVEKTGASAIR
ncbi:uncharacterized protein LOC123011941 [Tribolium madens]|uniref:uncharacterized protein LOC123011941 n=1 Tax=Tribolium madens TaxID=41895 RepID=UPI001CF7440A|nr:uncharacterized protein LOC123011941 [Tribolium madens]